MSIMPEKLRTFDYYKSKLPIYLQNSNGFQEHFKIWYDVMMGNNNDSGIIPVAETILELLNIFDGYYDENNAYVDVYLNKLNSMKSYENETSDILDKIGSIFDIQRKLRVEIEENGQTNYYVLSLSDEEFLLLIKCTIIKNYCEGTREQIQQYYRDAGLDVSIVTTSEPATVQYYLKMDSSISYSDNVIKLMKSGHLIIHQMGINYIFATINPTNVLTFDGPATNPASNWAEDETSPGGEWL